MVYGLRDGIFLDFSFLDYHISIMYWSFSDFSWRRQFLANNFVDSLKYFGMLINYLIFL